MAAAMDHRISGPDEVSTTELDTHGRLGPRHGLDRAWSWASSWSFTKFVAYGWSSQRSVPALRDQVAAALASALDAGWDGVAAEQADAFARVLGRRGRRDRRAGRAAAGRPVRDVPRLPGPRPRRATRDPGQGPDRPRLRRTRVLGHRECSCCRCSAPPPRTPPPTRCAGGTSTLDLARERARARCDWPAPRSRGARSAARSARRTGRPGTAAFHVNADIAVAAARHYWWTARRGLRPRLRPAHRWSRPLGCGCARLPRRRRPLPHRRRHRPGRVQRDVRRQRLHEPDGGQNLRAAAAAVTALPGAGRGAVGQRGRRSPTGPGGRPHGACRTATSTRCTSSPAASPCARCGTSSGRHATASTRCC